MSASRSFASLSATLLARKGGARPAMRPQLASRSGSLTSPTPADPLDDLGWNDMGFDAPVTPAPVAAIVPRPAAVVERPQDRNSAFPAAPVVPLLASKPTLAAVVPLVSEAPVAPAAGLADVFGRPVVKRTRPAAFTLRLEPDRHYRLRLACALKSRSAQSLVTEALDRFLAELPAVEPRSEPAPVQRTA